MNISRKNKRANTRTRDKEQEKETEYRKNKKLTTRQKKSGTKIRSSLKEK